MSLLIQQMTRSCRACQTAFEITEEDLVFYDKASPIVDGRKESIPPPTLCPRCRNKRRMAWRNERSLYNGVCLVCQQSTITMFRPGTWVRQVCHRCYYTDRWDPMSYEREYDFSVPFAENMRRLLSDVPQITLSQAGVNENCDYMNFAGGGGCKNCYLIFNSGKDEDCYYSRGLIQSRDCSDMLIASECERCYGCVNCTRSYGLSFSRNCSQCTDSAWLFNCTGCRNCIGCVNLSHQEYRIFNQPVTREQFEQFYAKMGSHAFAFQVGERFEALVRDAIHRATNNVNIEQCSGDYLVSCRNCIDCFEAKDAEDCRYMTSSKLVRDSHDTFGYGYESELLYECVGVGHSIRAAFGFSSDTVSDSYYCLYCHNAPHCFACIGLLRQQYCILNKQYTKAEYEALVPKIIEQMRQPLQAFGQLPKGSEVNEAAEGWGTRFLGEAPRSGEGVLWGEYLPASLSPFGYNETVGMEYDPMTKEEALAQGYNWSDYVAPLPQVEKVITASRLPDNIKDIPDEILNWAVECEVTGKPFRVVKPELKFLRDNNLPFPRRHPDTRHFDRVAMRNPRRLFNRACAQCAKMMQTSYAPERLERVYCEECYRKEVY